MKNIALILMILTISSCTSRVNRQNPFTNGKVSASIELIAESTNKWTGLTISKEGRIFVCFPRWSDKVPLSVGEIVDGETQPFPDSAWNSWNGRDTSASQFICVQSVYVDDQNYLWVLDPASPFLMGVVPQGARLYKFDLDQNKLLKSYTLPKTIAPEKSYLNDIRVDTGKEIAYITESGLGAIIVIDLKTGTALRRLANHSSTKSALDSIVVEGVVIKAQIHADGIELSQDRKSLYYQALTGRHLFRIPTDVLINPLIDDVVLESKVESVAEVGVNDGIIGDRFGNIFLSSLETNSINVLTSENRVVEVIRDNRIQWPDTFTKDSQGNIYFTVAQLHLPADPNNRHKIFKIVLH